MPLVVQIAFLLQFRPIGNAMVSGQGCVSVSCAMEEYAAWDWDGFDIASLDVERHIVASTMPVPSASILDLHALGALVGTRHKDMTAAVASLRAIRAIDPDWCPDAALAPMGSFFSTAWLLASLPYEEHYVPTSDENWTVDGLPHASRIPIVRSAIVQHMSVWGVLHTWRTAGGTLPPDLMSELGRPDNLMDALAP